MSPATRFLLAVLVAVAVLGGAPWWRGSDVPDAVQAARFYRTKALFRRQFDLVVAGDSRVARGVDPEAMRDVLGPIRIGNLGFDANSLVEPTYLAYLPTTLAEDAVEPTLVLGISPFALTPGSARRNGWLRFDAEARAVGPAAWMLGWEGLFAPLGLVERTGDADLQETYRPDGYLRTATPAHDPTARLARYRAKFDDNRVTSEATAVLLDAVQTWVARGIRVIAFRTEVGEPLRALEDARSGFDEARFRAAFEARGGVWRTLPDHGMRTYDGEHPVHAAAVRQSVALAEAIAAE